jgi:hypothetical protein
MWLLTPHDHFWTTVPDSSSCLISSALEQVADVPADERDLLAPGARAWPGSWRGSLTRVTRVGCATR